MRALRCSSYTVIRTVMLTVGTDQVQKAIFLRSLLFMALTGLVPVAIAGPPFFTDDPEPVDYHHWEFYLASEQEHLRHAATATLPHVEVNYGALPNVQLHVVAPMEYVRTGGGKQYGYSDTELGVKYRFVDETAVMPQIGIFPLVELPTGSKDAGLGNGMVQVYLPVWFQKSWGDLTTYGGGGFWYNPASDAKNWGFIGWQAQYDFSEVVSLGGELYYHTPDAPDATSGTAFSVGGFLNFNEHNHLLFSLGHSVAGEATTTAYFGYQLTI